jgi:hypothetical protein
MGRGRQPENFSSFPAIFDRRALPPQISGSSRAPVAQLDRASDYGAISLRWCIRRCYVVCYGQAARFVSKTFHSNPPLGAYSGRRIVKDVKIPTDCYSVGTPSAIKTRNSRPSPRSLYREKFSAPPSRAGGIVSRPGQPIFDDMMANEQTSVSRVAGREKLPTLLDKARQFAGQYIDSLEEWSPESVFAIGQRRENKSNAPCGLL